jgi:hypothetical protein
MRSTVFACVVAPLIVTAGQAAEWHLKKIDTPAPVTAIETIGGETQINSGGLWYRIISVGSQIALAPVRTPAKPPLPDGALPDGRIGTGTHDIRRAWLADPADRYDHGILGDAIEAGSLVIETRDHVRYVVRLKDDAVFEDLEPRIADLDGDGHDEIVLVKTYLKLGSSLAVVAQRNGKYDVVSETPPLGAPHRWLDPAGIADFNGDGKMDIALVRQPHVVGSLELWTWRDGNLSKTAEFPGVANHIAGTRAIHMAAVADFDGDGIADLAVPSLDRTRVLIIAFAAKAHEIASVPLPSKAVTDFGLIADGSNSSAIVAGLANGSLVVIGRAQ